MRICMLSELGRIRSVKQALALMKLGHKVDLMSRLIPFNSDLYTTTALWFDEATLRRAIKSSPADIFHIHNPPDNLVRIVREETKRPIVYDCHDPESLRLNCDPDQDEFDAFGMSDGIVHVSDACRNWCEAIHGKKKPSIVLHSYVNKEYTGPVAAQPCWGTLVYEGGLSPDSERKVEGKKFFGNMRYYLPVFKAFLDQGFFVSAFAVGGQDIMDDLSYENMGIFVTRRLLYPAMLLGLRLHGFGFVGAGKSYPLMEAAMPNKLFEYISQGVVPVVLNCAAAADFVTKYNCGIVIKDLDNLGKKLSVGPKIRKNILKLRHELTMENHINPLIKLYKSLL